MNDKAARDALAVKVLENVDELQGVLESPSEGELSPKFPLLELCPHGRVVDVRPALLLCASHTPHKQAARTERANNRTQHSINKREAHRQKETPRDCVRNRKRGAKTGETDVHKTPRERVDKRDGGGGVLGLFGAQDKWSMST